MKTENEIIQGLMWELHEINERILTGDICSNKTAMPKAYKLAERAKKELLKIECSNVFLDPYEAHGGWVGIVYSYRNPYIGLISGSCVPRRMS
jgi:hypothetical protein